MSKSQKNRYIFSSQLWNTIKEKTNRKTEFNWVLTELNHRRTTSNTMLMKQIIRAQQIHDTKKIFVHKNFIVRRRMESWAVSIHTPFNSILSRIHFYLLYTHSTFIRVGRFYWIHARTRLIYVEHAIFDGKLLIDTN